MSDEARIYDVTPEQRFMGPLLDDDYGFTRGATSGVRITSQNALQNSTVVLACVRVLAETVASLPLHVYRRLPNGGRERAPCWLDTLLSQRPNCWQTNFEWLEVSMTHLGLYGACYSEIVSGERGSVTELWPLHPRNMKVDRIENGRLRFTYTEPSGAKTIYNQDQIFRVTWMSVDGINGSVPVELGKEAIGLARACELHGSRFFGNGARPGVVLETESAMAPEAAERLRENWERMHRGPDKSGRTAVLTGGLKAHELEGQSNNDSQFLEARRFQVEEICRLYRIPPHMIQDLTRATYSNIEQQSIDFVQYSILPWLRRLEKAILRDLIAQPDLFAMFDTRALLRGDAASRMAFYSAGLDRGIFSINDVRAQEGMNPIDGGDVHYFPLNMTTVEKMAEEPVAELKATQQEVTPPSDVSAPVVLAILEHVKTGTLKPEAAVLLITESFPSIDSDKAQKIVAGAAPAIVATTTTDSLFSQRDCGTGAGGFKPGNDCASGDGDSSADKSTNRPVSKIISKIDAMPRQTMTGRPSNSGSYIKQILPQAELPNSATTGVTQEAFQKAKTSTVSLSSVKATQDGLNADKLKSIVSDYKHDDQPISVVRHKGVDYIWDGHHRAAAAQMLGHEDIKAKVVEV